MRRVKKADCAEALPESAGRPVRNIKHYNVTLHKRPHSYHSQRQKKAAAWKKVAYKNAERHTGKGQGTASLWTVYAVHDMVVTSNLKRYRGRGLPETEKKDAEILWQKRQRL